MYFRFAKDEELKEEVHYPDLDVSSFSLSEFSLTLEGQVVAIADEIAQCTHDLEDAARQSIMDINDLKQLAIVKKVQEKNTYDFSNCRYANEIKMHLLYHMIDMLIEDVYHTSITKMNGLVSHPTFADEKNCIYGKMIAFSDETKKW